MEALVNISIFLAGLGVFFASLGLLWWVSLYEKVKFPKQGATSTAGGSIQRRT